jgi:hypothetical protein
MKQTMEKRKNIISILLSYLMYEINNISKSYLMVLGFLNLKELFILRYMNETKLEKK